MKVHLACVWGVQKYLLNGELKPEGINALESFQSMQSWEIPLLNRFSSFLLDSGAFTFMSNASKHGTVDWNSYADKYADFIRENRIKQYFELDIDSIVGLKEVERLRRRIENRSGVQSIPVWHKSRGKEYFEAITKDYKYVAIGGIVTNEIPKAIYRKMFPWFIATAHKNGAKIHALGYTETSNLNLFRFDSVDSSSWKSLIRYGQYAKFENGRMYQREYKKNGRKLRIADETEMNYYNFKEWLKYQ